MRVDDLGISLRARTAWEATDLGLALVRANAARVFGAWFALTLPAWLLANLLCGLLGALTLAPFLMWWLKPVFDRSVLFVISRSVFGQAPGLRETLAAQRHWGWRAVVPWLLWRRLHPARALLLPIDLLEGVRGEQRRERASVLGRGDGATAGLLAFIGVNLEAMLYFSYLALALMFVPVEFLDPSLRAMFQTLFVDPPAWAQVLLNLALWLATSVVEPFYVGAGFGLYLNRRMQLEAWDIELAFRRMAARLAGSAAALLLACALGTLGAPPAHADDATQAAAEATTPPEAAEGGRRTLEQWLGDTWRDDAAPFDAAVREAYAGDDLRRTRRELRWQARDSAKSDEPGEPPEWAMAIGRALGFLFEYGLWILAAVALALVAVHWRRWLPPLAERLRASPGAAPPTEHDIEAEQPLPPDIVAAVRERVAAGRMRDALALLYRAAVARLVQVQGAPLPPGATEAQCLRHARALGDTGYAQLFGRIVGVWQAAAYAQRLPGPAVVEDLLRQWQQPASTAEAP